MIPGPFPDYSRPAATVLDLVADFVLLGAGLGAVVFVLMYAAIFNWRITAAGRAIFYFAASLVGVLALVSVSKLTGGDYPFRDLLRIIVYGFAFVSTWRLVAVLVVSWHRGAPTLDLRERPRRAPIERTLRMTDLPGTIRNRDLEQVDERILNTVDVAVLEDGSTITATNVGVPTQIANPVRATVRTVAAVVVGLVLALSTVNAVLGVVASELANVSGFEIPGWVWAVVNGAILGVGLVSGIVTRVLAIPGVNAWLASHAVTRPLTAVPVRPAVDLLADAPRLLEDDERA